MAKERDSQSEREVQPFSWVEERRNMKFYIIAGSLKFSDYWNMMGA